MIDPRDEIESLNDDNDNPRNSNNDQDNAQSIESDLASDDINAEQEGYVEADTQGIDEASRAAEPSYTLNLDDDPQGGDKE